MSEYIGSRHAPIHERAFLFRERAHIFPKAELAFIGDVPVAYAGWGNHLPIEEMIRRWDKGVHSDAAKEAMMSYGMSGGFYYGDEWDRRSPEAHVDYLNHITALASGLMHVRGWKTADLHVATISDNLDIVNEVAGRLEDEGLRIERTRGLGLACDGAGGAMIDAIADPRMQGRQAIFIGAEVLTGKSVPRDSLIMSTLFGNGAGGTAFIPGEEISLVHPQLIAAQVVKDRLGVIEIPRMYDVDEIRRSHQGSPLPPYYTVDPEANFFYGEDRVANEMTTSGEYAQMKKETGVAFRAFVLPIASSIIQRHQEIFPDPEDRIRLALMHQPSKTILTNIAGKLRKRFGDRCPDMPWLMEGTGFNNISAGNILIAMAEAAKQGLIRGGNDFLMGTFGIGMSAHMAVLRME